MISISLVWGLYFCTCVRSISSRLRSPSHQTAKLTEFGWAPITSPLKLRLPPEALLHISQPGFVGSMSAAMERPTSVLEGTRQMILPVAASTSAEPTPRFSWPIQTCSFGLPGIMAPMCIASPWPRPLV